MSRERRVRERMIHYARVAGMREAMRRYLDQLEAHGHDPRELARALEVEVALARRSGRAEARLLALVLDVRHCPWCGRWPPRYSAERLHLQGRCDHRPSRPGPDAEATLGLISGACRRMASRARDLPPDDSPRPWQPTGQLPHRERQAADRRRRVLDAVSADWSTVAELAERAGLPVNSSLYKLVQALAVEGVLEVREGRPRGVRLARGPIIQKRA